MPHDRIRAPHLMLLLVCLMAVPVGVAAGPSAMTVSGPASEATEVAPLEEFSPGFLGIYRKVMEIEDEIIRYAEKYGIDPILARAVCMYESGGNANLTSWAGAAGYFQVMPATFRALRVQTNIEAGIKYLGQLVRQFGREDYALAGYNGGPGRVARGRSMPLESLQYVLGVGYFRSVLTLHEPSVRVHAARIGLEPVREGDDWWTLAQRLKLPLIQLRLHNPFLANRALRVGQLVAYPPEPRQDLLFIGEGNHLQYRTRLGDNYFNLAFTLDVDLDLLRRANGLWRLQTLPPGLMLEIPLDWTGKFNEHRVVAGETLETVAKARQSDPWRIIRDNNLFWDDQLQVGTVLRVRPAPPKPTYQVYRVRSGDNLGAIAQRYGTTVTAIQAANSMGRSTLIRAGQNLRIPAR